LIGRSGDAASRRPAQRETAVVVAVFGLVAIWFTGVFPPHANVNELSRFQAVVAFVERGTFAIDEELRRLGDHEDKAAWGGHFYSNKAPGLAFAAIPVYRALRSVFPPPRSGTAAIFVWMRLLTVSAVSVLALWRFARLLRDLGGGGEVALIVAAVGFGTPFLFYARSFFSHAWTASLLVLAVDRLFAAARRPRGGTGAAFAAGLLAAWAAISEYPVFLLLPLLALRALAGRNWPRALAFCAAAALPVALLLLYNAACFGSPLTLSSAREAHPQFAELAGRGVFGIGMPRPRILASYLFHHNRGLLLAAPFLAWAAWGFARWWRSGRQRMDAALSLAVTVVFLAVMSGYPNWEGGWCLGSRYLVPILFIAALAIPHALDGALSRGFFLAGVTFAAAHHALLASSFPYFPPSLPWPAATGSLWFLARGLAAPSLGTLAGLPPILSLLIPGLLIALAIVSALRAFPPTKPGKPAAALLGVAALAATLWLPVRLEPWDAQWREGILGLFVPR
jgi:hypothetical protein